MVDSTQEFSNENLKITMERKPGCSVSLDVTISPQASDASYRKAIKLVNKEVSLPGFRKGKAPEAMIVQHYAKYVDQEWKDLIVKTSFKDALDLTKTYPINENTIKRPQLKQTSRDDGSHVIFEMEVMPEIPEIDPTTITLERPKRKEVTEEDVDNAIMDLRMHHAAWEEITDRPVEEGDFVELDVDNIDDPENPICKDTSFEVADGKMGKWMRKLVVGKNIADVAEGMSEKEDHPDVEKATKEDDFKPTHCRITIKKIKKPDLPELDDAFAEKVGLKAIDELRSRVEEDLNRQSDNQVQSSLRDQLESFLDASYDFDIPASFFEGEKKSRMSRVDQIKQKLGEEEFEKVADRYSEEQINNEVFRSLRLYFLLQKISQANNVQVTQNELHQEMLAHLYNPHSRLIDPSMDAEEIRSKIYHVIIDRKAKDFLIEKASLVDPK